MNSIEIRKLKSDEIEVRVLSLGDKGYTVLLYKDARVDMKILDEIFGIYGWQRKHELINNNLFCTVSVYDKENAKWISKQDVGVESYAEKEKGQASDSFKRACTNIGIGRELYTAPFIWIAYVDGELKNVNGKKVIYTKLKVTDIDYNKDGEINLLKISDDKDRQRYFFKAANSKQSNNTNTITKEQIQESEPLAQIKEIPIENIENGMSKKNGIYKKIEEFNANDYAVTMTTLKAK